MTLQEYLTSLRHKTVAVIGIGVSNTPLLRRLLAEGIAVTACDRSSREKLGPLADELEAAGATLHLGEGYLDGLTQDVIFRTPGLRPDVPQLLAAQRQGSTLTSEMEVFFQVCPCHMIAVTGSDGKTTTTTILAEFLKEAGYNVYVGGNIGKPLLPDVSGMEPEDFAVLELSSFQLMTMEQSPHIAVMTNLSPNHLDYHRSMGEYIAAKENIFLHQGEGDRAIFNYDNQLTRDLAEKAGGAVTFFSRRERLEEGVYLRDGAIWLTNAQGSREVLPTRDIRLPGVHNIENYMAAIAAVDGLVPDKCVRAVAARFQGVEHRIELVRELDGVKYYNDSIGTSPSRTVACLESFPEPVILIAGGYDKGIPFHALALEIRERVKTLVLTGDTARAIRQAVEEAEGGRGCPEIIQTEDLAGAVEAARRAAGPGDVVVLSPACAAFDRFKNFMERGRAFKELVRSL